MHFAGREELVLPVLPLNHLDFIEDFVFVFVFAHTLSRHLELCDRFCLRLHPL